MKLTLHYVTDPACVRSWAAEPLRLRLLRWLGKELEVRYVMGGLARDLDVRLADSESGVELGRDTPAAMLAHWLRVAAESRMPIDPRLWAEAPLRSTYPACLAVKAAQEQGPEAAERYLREVRLGILCRRRRLDRGDALAGLAGEVGLDLDRFEIDANSHAIVERLGFDLELTATLTEQALDQAGATAVTNGRDRLLFPALVFEGPAGRATCFGEASWEGWAEAARTAGAEAPEPHRPLPEDLLQNAPLATREIEELAGLDRAEAESRLWELALAGRAQVERLLTGDLWMAG